MSSTDYLDYCQIIAETTGYDLSGYVSDSIIRRLDYFIYSEVIGSPDELRVKLLSDKQALERLMGSLLINYTEMFRDPDFFMALREKVLPNLATYNNINIWHAGCSTGEEVYSLAILLEELNLLGRCTIHASDINNNNVRDASQGIFTLKQARESSMKYFQSGGKYGLSRYYTSDIDHVIFHNRLKQRITFYKHDISREIGSQRFQMILCRNVCIYFNDDLQNRSISNLTDSLDNYGYLVLGSRENVREGQRNLSLIDPFNKIYRKVY